MGATVQETYVHAQKGIPLASGLLVIRASTNYATAANLRCGNRGESKLVLPPQARPINQAYASLWTF